MRISFCGYRNLSSLYRNLWSGGTLERRNFNHGILNTHFIKIILKIFVELTLLLARPLTLSNAKPIYTYTYLKISHNPHPQLNKSKLTCAWMCIWEWNSNVVTESWQNKRSPNSPPQILVGSAFTSSLGRTVCSARLFQFQFSFLSLLGWNLDNSPSLSLEALI